MAVSLLCSATALKQVWSREPAAEIAQAGTASASEKKNTALELYVCAQTLVMIKSQDLHQMYEAIALFLFRLQCLELELLKYYCNNSIGFTRLI